MTTDAKRLQDQMQAAKFAHTDPHRGTCDDCGARLTVPNVLVSTRSGFTDRRESDETAESVSVDADAGERRTEPLSGIPVPLDHDRTEFRTLAPESTPGDHAVAEGVSVVEQAARVLRESPAASPGGKAQALADAGLLRRPTWTQVLCEAQVTRAEGERDRARATAVALEQEVARLTEERDEARAGWQRMSDYADHRGARVAELEAEVEVAQREQARLHESRDAAEARARRAAAYACRVEDALREVRSRVREERHAPHCACWTCATVRIIDRALSAAGQTSDATPSDTTKED